MTEEQINRAISSLRNLWRDRRATNNKMNMNTEDVTTKRMCALNKALEDCFDYCLKLRTGEVIRFGEASIIDKDWVHLSYAKWDDGQSHYSDEGQFHRGIDVRISDIVWVMDAPYGS